VYEIGDQVAMKHQGVIHFQGTPEELKATADPIVREFLERTDQAREKQI
jgi:ABC-type transporter Mla maintaining outer membrane lipid asymmetry ATPase subunit MlaF